MDPLSVAAGVAGLLSLAIQLVEIGTKYGTSSPKAQGYDFIFELRALIEVLTRLKGFLEGPDAPPTFDHMSTLLSTNTRCKWKLQEVLMELQKTMQETNKLKRAVDRLMWPLTVKDHREAIEDIHRYTEVFNFALTVEGCVLLSTSSTETLNALKEQAQKIEETKVLCMAMPDLVIQIEASLARLSFIQDIVQALPDMSTELASISREVSGLKTAASNLERHYNQAERVAILAWLSPMTFEAKQRKLFERHQKGTGEWLINHELFKAWKATRGSKIWCPGIPGVGKTSMASFVVQTLIELYNSPDAIPTAFVFADFKDKERYQQDQHTIVSTVTRQLASQNPAVMNEAYARYRAHKEHSLGDSVAPLTFAEHLEILKNASSHVDRMFIVIDAVDEIPSTEEVDAKDIRFELLHALTQLEYVSILCTSRPHIESSSFCSSFSTLPIEATDKDLRTFMEAEILSSRRLSNVVGRDSSLKEEIIRTITQKAAGVFLLARFQIKEVKTAMSPRQVRSTLEKLSGKLKDMYVKCWYADTMVADIFAEYRYETTLDRVRSQPEIEARLGLRAVSWVANVVRPLTVSEFVHALSLEPDDDSLDSGSLIDISLILETCAGLLQLQPASLEFDASRGPFESEDTVELVHYTLQEYMDSSGMAAQTNSDVANTSLSYLCLKDFRRKGLLYHSDSRRRYPFLAYAAPFWPAHAKDAGDTLRKDLVEMLISEAHPETGKNWLGSALRRHFGGFSFHIPLGFAAAAVAIHGALNVLEFMVGLGLFINVRFRTEFNPFGFALPVATHDCMQVLFAGGLTHDAGMNRAWAAAALRLCHKYNAMDLFTQLLESNIDVLKASDHADFKTMSDDTWKESPTPTLLNEATWLHEDSIVTKLVQAGWDMDVAYSVPDSEKSRYKYSTALHDATRQGSVSIVQILADAGCRLNGISHPAGLQAPIYEATKLYLYGIANLLKHAGADPVEIFTKETLSSAWATCNHADDEVENSKRSWNRIFQQQISQEREDSHYDYDFCGNKKRRLSWIP